MPAGPWSTSEPVFVEDIKGSARPAAYYLAETRDGLYVPYALRTPADEGTLPVRLPRLRQRRRRDRLAAAVRSTDPRLHHRAPAGRRVRLRWGRYRTEVELGFHHGGPLLVDGRQGMEVMNRSPLEFEDELAILAHVAAHPRVDAGRLGHVGVSHAGEMLFKLASQYPGAAAGRRRREPANHEFLEPEPSTSRRSSTRHRAAQHRGDADAGPRARTGPHRRAPGARERIAPIDLPILVMGRDDDHLQGIFRVSYDLLEAPARRRAWVTWDHPLHGYILPEAPRTPPGPTRSRSRDRRGHRLP